jgi:heat shock protein HslJ
VGEQENQFYAALPRVATYHLDGDTLTLSGDGDRVQLTFRAS